MSTHFGTTLPPAVRDLFPLPSCAEGQCVIMVTADPDGTPRPCLLSIGEITVKDDRTLRVLTWPGSRTTANLDSGRAALVTAVAAPDVFHLRATGRRLPTVSACELALFELTVSSVEVDGHEGLPVTQPMWFTARADLSAEVLATWRAQHAWMGGAR